MYTNLCMFSTVHNCLYSCRLNVFFYYYYFQGGVIAYVCSSSSASSLESCMSDSSNSQSPPLPTKPSRITDLPSAGLLSKRLHPRDKSLAAKSSITSELYAQNTAKKMC